MDEEKLFWDRGTEKLEELSGTEILTHTSPLHTHRVCSF